MQPRIDSIASAKCFSIGIGVAPQTLRPLITATPEWPSLIGRSRFRTIFSFGCLARFGFGYNIISLLVD